MILYKFRTTAKGNENAGELKDRPIDITRFVVALHYAEALQLLDKNWSEIAFKRTDSPNHEFLGEITQETNGVFNECEIVNPRVPR